MTSGIAPWGELLTIVTMVVYFLCLVLSLQIDKVSSRLSFMIPVIHHLGTLLIKGRGEDDMAYVLRVEMDGIQLFTIQISIST